MAGTPLDEAPFALIEEWIKRGTQPMETTVIDVASRRRVTRVLARRVLRKLWEAAA